MYKRILIAALIVCGVVLLSWPANAATVQQAGIQLTATLAPAPPAPTCQVRYSIQSQWQNGFVADVTVKNLGVPISGWTLGWVFAGDQRISNMWNAQPTQTGASVSARNADWNAAIATGGQVNFGFQASFSGSNAKPTVFTLNGLPCLVEGVSTPTSTPTPSPTKLVADGADLVIDDFWLHPQRACFDPITNPLGARLIVRNAGFGPAGPFYVDINGTRLHVSAGLPMGQSVTLWAPVANPSNSAFVDSTNLVAEVNESNNQVTKTFPTATPPPTCTPTSTPTPSRTPTPTPTRESWSISASVTASASAVQVGDSLVVTASSTLGVPRYTLTVIDQATGQAQSLTNPIFDPAQPAPITTSSGAVSWTLRALRAGSVVFSLHVHGETYSGSCNCFYFTSTSATSAAVTVSDAATPTPTALPSGPDLALTAVEVKWGSGPIGTAVPAGTVIHVRVKNIGSAAAGPFVTALSGSMSGGPERVSSSGLAAGQETTLVFAYRAGLVTALADADGQVAESNESNNGGSANIPIP